jgi:hypothetical protein
LFVSFFSAVIIVLTLYHLYAFFLRRHPNRRKYDTDLFGEHYEKALHDIVFDNVFISAEARHSNELTVIPQGSVTRTEPRKDALQCLPSVISGVCREDSFQSVKNRVT